MKKNNNIDLHNHNSQVCHLKGDLQIKFSSSFVSWNQKKYPNPPPTFKNILTFKWEKIFFIERNFEWRCHINMKLYKGQTCYLCWRELPGIYQWREINSHIFVGMEMTKTYSLIFLLRHILFEKDPRDERSAKDVINF